MEGSGWDALVRRLTVADLVSQREQRKLQQSERPPLVYLDGDATVATAMARLAHHNLLSAPVIEPGSRRFLGFIDVLDITGYILASYNEHADDRNYLKKELLNENVSNILNFSHCDDRVIIDEANSVHDLIVLFSAPRFKRRLHRVAAAAARKKEEDALVVNNVVSLSDVIALAASKADLLPPERASATIRELKAIKPMIGVRMDSSVVDALDILYRNKISGIALTDNEGRVSGNLSASDLRGLKPESFNYFEGSVLQFFVKGLPKEGTGHESGPGRAPVTCTEDATLTECMKLMVQERVHRVYVVDNLDALHIYGVVSMSDIIHYLK